ARSRPPALHTSSPRPRRDNAGGTARTYCDRWPTDSSVDWPRSAWSLDRDDRPHRLEIVVIATLLRFRLRKVIRGETRIDDREAGKQASELGLLEEVRQADVREVDLRAAIFEL